MGEHAGQLQELAETGGWYVDLGRIVYLPDAPLASSVALREVLTGIAAWVERTLAASLLTELTIASLQAMDRWSLVHLDDLAPGDRDHLAHLQVDVIRRLLAPAGADASQS